ncbi:hypothetical protein ACN38_g10112 [Penicillium nordicum]|uniref:Uncharacterized protein n=1 Tax=Penicillium nordicum TaxID=229535 RepID=A0A0M8NUJ2_9EURO|nr:hypothetical protein ACN38_g10112 [Penicillium nordicum]
MQNAVDRQRVPSLRLFHHHSSLPPGPFLPTSFTTDVAKFSNDLCFTSLSSICRGNATDLILSIPSLTDRFSPSSSRLQRISFRTRLSTLNLCRLGSSLAG